MQDGEVEPHMQEWLRIHGTQGQREEYRAFVERRNRMTEDHETRLRAVEIQITEVKGQLREMATEAHDTRIEVNGQLKVIVDEVKMMAREQEREAGRREGTAASVALALRGEDRRDSWAQTAIPYLVALAIFAMGAWIMTVQQGSETNASTVVVP